MTKAQENAKLKAQNDKLRKMLADEREKVARYEDGEGYEGVYRIQNAYVAHLLVKMGATEENPVTILKEEITKSMEHYNVRADISEDGSWKFYVKEI